MAGKKKLLVVVGAGASVEFGMPSVTQVGALLSQGSLGHFALDADPARGVYDWLTEAVEAYWKRHIKPGLLKTPSFEDILYLLFQLGTLFPNGARTSPIGAFADPVAFPVIRGLGGTKLLDQDDLRQLGSALTDILITHFRGLCRGLDPAKTPQVDLMRSLFAALSADHDVAVVTLNYDDVIWRCLPTLETGFAADGTFEAGRLLNRTDWPCFLHLHGSVHFDMAGRGGDLHAITWQDDLNAPFQQNAAGRNGVQTTEGLIFPQSAIVAGYGKTQQILRRPFRTYYSELDRLVDQSDALLCLGYGFADDHLNAALEGYRDRRRRKVALIDFAQDGETSAAGARFDPERALNTAMMTFRNDANAMSALGYTAPMDVRDLKAAQAFDQSIDPDTPLAVWYGGMLQACRHSGEILKHL